MQAYAQFIIIIDSLLSTKITPIHLCIPYRLEETRPIL